MWRDIDTAARDGTRYLLFYPKDPVDYDQNIVVEGWYFTSPKRIDDGWETCCGFIGEPTHFMSCPAPPEAPEPPKQ